MEQINTIKIKMEKVLKLTHNKNRNNFKRIKTRMEK
jgi:hypothetical protein